MPRGTQGHGRKLGTTQVGLEITTPAVTTSKQVQQRIDSLNLQIVEIQAQIVELEAEKLLVSAEEPDNLDAVNYSIQRLDSGVNREIIEAELEIAPWNFNPGQSNIIVNDAEAIIAER